MQWRVVPSLPEYEVSEFGDVRRRLPGIRGGVVGKVMKAYVRPGDGYRRYILRSGNHSWQRKAHQLVLEAFIGPKPFPKAEGRHMDGTRTNDHFSNLEWGTSKENKADMLRHGTRLHGEAHHRSKLTLAQVVEIKASVAAGETQLSVADRMGIRQPTVSKIVHGKVWQLEEHRAILGEMR